MATGSDDVRFQGKTASSRPTTQMKRMTQADLGYWVCMFISGTLGTVIGDFCWHNMGLDDAGASILLSPIVAVLFLAGRGGRLLLLPFYWLTVVLIRAAGTAVGDFISGRNMLGLPVSTAVTGLSSLPSWSSGGGSRDQRERSPSLPDEVRLAP